MAVTTPNTTAQETEAERQRRIEDERLTQVRQAELDRILSEYGGLEALYSDLEKIQAGYDRKELAAQGKVSAADQMLRYLEQQYGESDNAREQITADINAAVQRAEARAQADRYDQALMGVEDAYSGYNDPFFDKYASDIVSGIMPGLEAQQKEERRAGGLGLAQQGIRNSSAAIRQLAALAGKQTSERASLADSASNSAEALRTQIMGQRASALQMALQAAGIQRPVPYEGGTIADILAAQGYYGAGGPVLPPGPGDGVIGPPDSAAPAGPSDPAAAPAEPGAPSVPPLIPPAPPAGPAGPPDINDPGFQAYLNYLGTLPFDQLGQVPAYDPAYWSRVAQGQSPGSGDTTNLTTITRPGNQAPAQPQTGGQAPAASAPMKAAASAATTAYKSTLPAVDKNVANQRGDISLPSPPPNALPPGFKSGRTLPAPDSRPGTGDISLPSPPPNALPPGFKSGSTMPAPIPTPAGTGGELDLTKLPPLGTDFTNVPSAERTPYSGLMQAWARF